jgi:two-component system chemotaxis response regulator CheY
MSGSLDRLKVLVVDDKKNMRRLVSRMLKAMGIDKVREARNGEDALQKMNNFMPDIVITDWVMEPIDGIELTQYLRSEESPDPFIPVIMMTGHSEAYRVQQARDCGVTEFLAKPLSAQTLCSRVAAVINKPRPFIRTKTFFGPCRRRHNWADYMGQDRRKTAEDRQSDNAERDRLEELLDSL